VFKKEDIKAVLIFVAALATVFYQVWVATGPK